MRPFLALAILAPLSACGGVGTQIGLPSTNAASANRAHFLDISAPATFEAIGTVQSYTYNRTNKTETYEGNASTVRAPMGSVTYNPRDGVFSVTLGAPVSANTRYQDPAHRGNGGGDTPDLAGYNYLSAAGTAAGSSETFFYLRPTAGIKYVTLAGFSAENSEGARLSGIFSMRHGAVAFGEKTPAAQVPKTGSANYAGSFLATMMNQPGGDARPEMQWLAGNSTFGVDFSTGKVNFALDGSVRAPAFEYPNSLSGAVAYPGSGPAALPAGTKFSANATAVIDMVRSGGFTGKFDNAGFTLADGSRIAVDFTSVNPANSVAGASSLDGTFYGPTGQNIGAGFRIVGGIPGQRVDIGGAAVGGTGE